MNPDEIILQVCLCDALNWLLSNPARLMAFCIALERLAMSFPTLKCIVVHWCGVCWPTWTDEWGPILFHSIVHKQHKKRTYSGSNWDVLASPELHLEEPIKRYTMSWNSTQVHPGQAVESVPWKRRMVNVDFYDTTLTQSATCVRTRIRPGSKRQSKLQRQSVVVRNEKDKSRWSSLLGTVSKDIHFKREWITRYDVDSRTHR